MALYIAPYDPQWPAEFTAEEARILDACRGLPIRLEHIGSTSVPGLDAKPVIDILAGCPPRASRAEYVAALRQIGYEHKGAFGIPGRNYFRRGSPRSHHVHMVSWSSAFWHRQLAFRDALRTDASLRREYAVLKRELARTFADDVERYASAKGPFIASVLRQIQQHAGVGDNAAR
jgi:GrpB-like predicted nucleotidyltransferase (UPF0157 family)